MVRVRLASLADAADLPRIERSAGQTFRSMDDLAWLADDTGTSVEQHQDRIRLGTTWVAESDVLCGFLSTEATGNVMHLCELSVDADHQRRGIGAQLIAAAEEWCRDRGLHAMELTTFRDVPWNEPYYTRLGFTTLRTDAIDERLASILAAEVKHGLPAGRRCAMRKVLA